MGREREPLHLSRVLFSVLAAAWWTTLRKLCCFCHLSWQDSSSSIWPEKHDMTLEDSQQENDNNTSFHLPSLGSGSEEVQRARQLQLHVQLTWGVTTEHNFSVIFKFNGVSMKIGVEDFAKKKTKNNKASYSGLQRQAEVGAITHSRARGLLCPERHAWAAPHASLASRYFPVWFEPEGRKLAACFFLQVAARFLCQVNAFRMDCYAFFWWTCMWMDIMSWKSCPILCCCFFFFSQLSSGVWVPTEQ